MKKLMKKYKRGLAGFMACCIMMTSVNTAAWAGEGLGTAGTDTGKEIQMHLDTEQLQEAALDAIIDGYDDETKKITPETLGLLSLEEDSVAKKYQKLFSENEDGDFYEVFPEFKEEDQIPEYASLRMFVRANTSDDYKLSGKEDVVLLFSNSSDERLGFRVWMDDNYLPVVSVKANTSESVDVEETIPAPTEESTEGATDESESAAPEESEAASEGETEAETNAEETEATDQVETDAVETDAVETDAVETDAVVETDAPQDANDDTQADDNQEAAAEPEVAAEEPAVSISSRKAPIVTTSSSDDDEDIYFEDVDLIDDINGEVPVATNSTSGAQEIKPVKLDGKLFDEITLTTEGEEASSVTARAFVSTMDKLFVKSEAIIVATGSNATLVVKHAHVSEGDSYYYVQNVVTDLKSGTLVNGADYDSKNVLFPLVKSEPAQLELVAGDNNEITLYYGIDKVAMSQMTQSWKAPSRSKFRSANVALTPGRVEARKTSVWTDQTNGKAKISLSVEGEPVKRPLDVILVLDASGSMWQAAGNLGNNEFRLDMAVKAANKFTEVLFKENETAVIKNRLGVVLFGGEVGSHTSSEFGSTFGNASGSQNPQMLSSTTETFATIRGMTRLNLNLNDVFDAYWNIRNTTGWGLSTYFQSGLGPALEMVKKYGSSPHSNNGDLHVIMMSDGDSSDQKADYIGYADAIKEKATLHTIGLALDKGGNEGGIQKLKDLATSEDLYTNVSDPHELEAVFVRLAKDLTHAGTNAVMRDTLSDGFEIDPTWRAPEGVKITTDADGKTVIEWSIGNITKDSKSLDIPIKVKDGAELKPGETPTNADVNLTYKDVAGKDAEKGKKDIGDPTLTVGGGSIHVKYYLVNEAGQFVDVDGAIIEEGRENFKHVVSEALHTDGETALLTLGKNYSITPKTEMDVEGETYILYGSNAPVVAQPTILKPSAEVVFKVYKETKKKDLSFEAIDQSKVYDGDELTLTKDAYKPIGLDPEHRVEITFKDGKAPSITDADTKALDGSEVEIKIVDKDGKDVTSKYNITLPTGTMSVTTRPITITAGSGEKKYDKTALLAEALLKPYSITSTNNLVKEHQVDSITIAGSQTEIGFSASSAANAVIKTKDGSTDVSKNYAITYEDGTLTILSNPQSINITYQYKSGDEGNAADLPKNINESKEYGDTYEYLTKEISGYMADLAVVSGTVEGSVTKTVTYYKVSGKDYRVPYNGEEYTFDKNAVTGYITGSELTYSTTGGDDFGIVLPTFTDVKVDENGAVIPYTVYVKATKDGVSTTVAVSVTVEQKPVTIAARQTTKPYDGVTIYAKDDATISSGVLVGGHAIEISEASGEALNVTSTDVPAIITKALIKNGETDVTHNYKLSYVEGYMRITKATNVELRATGIDKYYDGEASEIVPKLYVDGSETEFTGTVKYTYEVNGLPWTSSLKFTEAGTYKVHITAETENYETRTYDGEAIIKKRPITITADSVTEQFSSATIIPFVKHSFTNTPFGTNEGLLANHAIVDVTYDGELHGIGGVDNTIKTFEIKTTGESARSVKANYDWTLAKGKLVLSAGAQLGITGENINVPYDGKGHSLDLTITGGTGKLQYATSPDGPWSDTIDGKVDAGEHTIYVKAVGTNYEDSAVREFKITINKLIATYKANNDSKVYDGTPLTNGGHTIMPEAFKLADGDELEIAVTGSALDVTGANGEANTITTFKIYHTYADGSRVDVSKINYDITLDAGKLIITASGDNKVEVSGNTGTYHGKEWTFADPTAKEGSKFYYSTDNGTTWTEEKPSFINANEDGYHVQVKATHGNYKETAVETVIITINKRPIQITADSASKPYDATKLEVNTYKVTALAEVEEQGLAEGDTVKSVLVAGTITDVGSVANIASDLTLKNTANVDVTGNYKPSYVNGLLEITRNNYTLNIKYVDTVGDEVFSSKTLDGYNYNDPYSVESPTISGYIADKAVVSGNMPNNNHEVIVTFYKPTAAPIEAEYDGIARGISKGDIKEIPAGSKIEFSTSVDGTYSETAPTFTDANRADGAPNGNPDKVYVKVTTVDGLEIVIEVDVEITQRPITLQATVADKQFVPNIHITAIDEVKITERGLVNGHKIQHDADSWTGEAREVTLPAGIETVLHSVTIVAGSNPVTGNYKITFVDGNIKISAAGGNVVNVSDKTDTYNGKEWTLDDPTSGIEGSTFEYSTDGGATWSKDKPSYTDAGDYDVKVKATHPNYEPSPSVDVKITINKRPIQITAGSKSKPYDGEELTDDSYKVTTLDGQTIQGIADGDTLTSATVTGTITEIGTVANVASAAKFTNEAGEDVTNNYAPVYGNGKLEITANNYKLTVTYVDTEGKTVATTHETEGYNFNGDFTVTTPQVTGYVAETAVVSGKMPKGNHAVTVIFHKPTADGITAVYDGKGHGITNENVSGYPEGSTVEFSTSKDGGWSGTAPTFTEANRKGDKPNGNPDKIYVKVSKDGQETIIEVTVEIKQKPITIQATVATQTYVPGMRITAIDNPDVTNPNPIEGHLIVYKDWTGEATNVTPANGITTKIKEVAMMDGEQDRTANYDIKYVDGKLIVTASGGNVVTVTDKEGIYNGDAWTFNDPSANPESEFWYSTDGGASWSKDKPSYIDAGVYDVQVKATNPNYEDSPSVDVKITINKRPIQITAGSKSKAYDAEPLTDASYEVTTLVGATIQGLADGDTLTSATVTGTITEIGKVDNVASAAKFTNGAGKDVTNNYAPVYGNGKLEITANNYKLTVRYVDTDGNEVATTHEKDGHNYKDAFTVTTPQVDKYVAETAVVSGTMPKDHHTITVIFHKPAAEGITAVYDGTGHGITNEHVSGYPEGSTIEFSTSKNGDWSDTAPTFTEANRKGDKPNGNPDKVYVKVTKDGHETIIEVDVVIKQKPITIQATVAEQTFVPEMHITAISDAKITNPNPITGHEIGYGKWTGEAKGVTSVDGVETVIHGVTIVDGETDKTGNYEITLLPGNVKVNPSNANVVEGKDITGTYHGDQWTFDDPTAVEGSEFYYSTDGGTTWSKDKPSYVDANEEGNKVLVKAEHPNYLPTDPIEVTITINRRPITVTADDAEKLFDNEPLTKNSASITEGTLADGQELAKLDIAGRITAVGIEKNTPSNAEIVVENPKARAKIDVTDNYKVTYVNGVLEVKDNPHNLDITYKYHAGEEGLPELLPEAYSKVLRFNDTYSVVTKEIFGYVADWKIVEGTMKLEGITVTVTYHKDENGNGLPDCDEEKHTITFKAAANGTLEGTAEFKDILTGTEFGKAVTIPNPKASRGYYFAGWNDVSDTSKKLPELTSLVTASKEYEAIFKKSSSGGGGGGNPTPGGGGSTDGGPGTSGGTTTIIPGEIPLASLPPVTPDGSNMLIDDGEVPYAALPKTGDRGTAAQLAVMLSALFAGLFIALAKKKEEE